MKKKQTETFNYVDIKIKKTGKVVAAKSYGFGFVTSSSQMYHKTQVKVVKKYQVKKEPSK